MYRDEDLTLAPIEDDRDAYGSGASKSDVTSVSATDLNVDVQALSRIEEEIGESASTSGSMIDLLSDPHMRRVSTSGVVLRRPKQGVPPWVIVLSCIGGVLLVVLLIGLLIAMP